MPPALFYIFATIMLSFGLLVVVLRNPVASGLSLVVSFLGLAALFVSLNATFIGVIQILVYAGAVMVLFLFIIMLLDLKSESKRKINGFASAGGVALVAAFVIQLVGILGTFIPGKTTLAEAPINLAHAAAIRENQGTTGTITDALNSGSLPDVHLVGETLFTDYNFHLQIVAVLLLVAAVGVVVLSKKELR